MSCRCGGTGVRTFLDKNDPSGVWHTVSKPCDCIRILSRQWPWWMLAALMLTLGLSPAAWELFK